MLEVITNSFVAKSARVVQIDCEDAKTKTRGNAMHMITVTLTLVAVAVVLLSCPWTDMVLGLSIIGSLYHSGYSCRERLRGCSPSPLSPRSLAC